MHVGIHPPGQTPPLADIPSPWADIPLGKHPMGRHPPGIHPQPSACWDRRGYCCGRYSSYWNAVLFYYYYHRYLCLDRQYLWLPYHFGTTQNFNKRPRTDTYMSHSFLVLPWDDIYIKLCTNRWVIEQMSRTDGLWRADVSWFRHWTVSWISHVDFEWKKIGFISSMESMHAVVGESTGCVVWESMQGMVGESTGCVVWESMQGMVGE